MGSAPSGAPSLPLQGAKLSMRCAQALLPFPHLRLPRAQHGAGDDVHIGIGGVHAGRKLKA